MIKNYFKAAFRHLVNNKVHTFINISGLAAGMAVAMLIALWMWDELSFNKYHQNYDRIARVMQNQTFDGEVRTWGSQAMQMGPELRNTYGNHFRYVVVSSFNERHILSSGDKRFSKTGNFMEPEAPDMLTLKMLKGTRAGLKDPGSILLAASTAETLFGDADPVNQVIQIDNKLNVKVTGVYEDLPYNSSFNDLHFIAPWQLKVRNENLEARVGWGNSWFQVFVQIADRADMQQVSAGIKKAKANKEGEEGARYNPEIFLHPMSKWRLYSDFKNGVIIGGGIKYVWMFGIIGVFVLLLACINFMNLSTARSEKRAKEVGVRKAIGSLRSQLVSQFFAESLLLAVLAFVLSMLLVMLILPWFNNVADKKVSILWLNPWFWLGCIGFTIITGLIAGSYPALYLSSFKPVKVLKGTFRVGQLAAIPRKVLVVLQFSVSATLIICTVIVFSQIQYARNRPIGYSRHDLLALPQTENLKKHYEAFRNDLLSTGTAIAVSQSESTAPGVGVTNSGFVWRGKDPGMQDEIVTVGVDHTFGKTIDWQIKEGRDFSPAFASDTFGFILNEAAVKYMGFKDPIGEQVRAFGGNYHVIGVVKDMMMQSPYDPIRQMIFYIDIYDRINFVNIKINPGLSAGAALGKIEQLFKKYDPVTPFEFSFADEEYDANFRSEERIGKLAGFFTILAILISCLGLFGMASFMAEQRTKEIGIRKVLGASVLNLWGLLSGDFVALVCIALIIATPLAWYFMHNWLQHYQYRTSISWWIFVATGIGAVSLTLVTVSYQAIKTALTNPVKSLKAE
ncbi:MAG TPA: ABC transporter permease [Chitinophaga sp.]